MKLLISSNNEHLYKIKKLVSKYLKNQRVSNELTNILVRIKELLRYLHCT